MDDEQQTKSAFAAILYRQPGAKPFEVALTLFPEVSTALRVSQEWPRDPYVLSEIARFAGEQSTEENKMPSKDELCREIWHWITSCNHATIDEKIKAAKLYAELNSMVPKEQAGSQFNTNTVMYVTDHGTELSWEQQLQLQQQGLINSGEKEINGEVVNVTNS